MRVSLINLKNCLGQQEVELQPGKITIIQGTSGTGKSSILESIKKMLTNKSDRPKFVYGDAEKSRNIFTAR